MYIKHLFCPCHLYLDGENFMLSDLKSAPALPQRVYERSKPNFISQ